MSATKSVPTHAASRRPRFGAASVNVASACTTGPGVAPVVVSRPDGASRASTGAGFEFIASISSAARPVGVSRSE